MFGFPLRPCLRPCHAIALLACVVLLPTAAGCNSIGGGAGSADRSRLIRDMSAQLDRGTEIVYHADYQLAGGKQGSISQRLKPRLVAYRYPGRLRLDGDSEHFTCLTTVRPPRCSRVASGSSDPSAVQEYADLTKRGLVVPQIVKELLRITDEQPAASVRQHDTTAAGLQATCLAVSGLTEAAVTDFSTCVTSDGVLASFRGTIDGTPIDQALIASAKEPSNSLFKLPANAKITDSRPK